MNKTGVVMVAMLVALALGIVHPGLLQNATSQAVGTPNRVLQRNADILSGRVQAREKEMFVSSGAMEVYMETLAARSGATTRTVGRASSVGVRNTSLNSLGCSNVFAGAFPNIRVNQDCTLRRQAEEAIAVNPLDASNLIASQNDSRLGFNHCGTDFSLDRGGKWGDEVPPFYQFIMANGVSPDACSDPTMVFDSRGNAYFGGILFQVNLPGSAVVVTKSNAANKGTFWHSPAPGPFQEYSANPLGVIASDANPAIFHDKELMAGDANPSSPKRDFLYMTWTRFTLTNSPIYFSQSTNGGATWSPGIEISGRNPALCTIFSGTTGDPNRCDQDQGSQPFVGKDGTVHVVFGNGNTPFFGFNQVLYVSCPPTNNCALATSWTPPVKVGGLIGTHPVALAPNTAGCPVGRQCLPPNGYRVPEFTSITGNVDPADTKRIYVTWSDFRSGGPPCNTLDFATSVPPCDNDVWLSISTNGGATWSPPKKLTPSPSAQWQPWSAVGPDGTLYVAYYDRQYGSCEFTGCNDITLAVSTNRGDTFTYHRITTASMPNLTTLNNPVQAGFLGDYMWVAADSGGAHIVWADTRPHKGTAPEEDIYYARFRR